MDKPLNEWTVGEVYRMCRDTPSCKSCPFSVDGTMWCRLKTTPCGWGFEDQDKEQAETAALKARIAKLEAELADERHRHDRYVDFELAQSKDLEVTIAALHYWKWRYAQEVEPCTEEKTN